MFFLLNDTATTEIYTLSLHDALPISVRLRGAGDGGRAAVPSKPLDGLLRARGDGAGRGVGGRARVAVPVGRGHGRFAHGLRSEEHTSELQSRQYLVCRSLLEKKKSYK